MRYVFALILYGVLTVQSAAQELSSFKAIYKIGIPNITAAEMAVSLKRKDHKFLYKSAVEPRGLGNILNIRAQSQSKIIKKGEHWLPLVYEKEVSDKDKRQEYRFDWKNYKAQVLYKGEQSTLDIKKGTVDENTFQLKLRADVINTLDSDFDQIYTLISDGRFKERRYVKKGEEIIEVADKRFNTIRIERYKNAKPDQIYWLSPKHDYLPIKIARMDGNKVRNTLTLKSWTPDG